MSSTPATSTIVAQAFREMGLAPISSFADDSAEARAASEQYPMVLQECLEVCDWAFASTLKDLSEISASAGIVSDPELTHAYYLPGDCVMFRGPVDKTVLWRVEQLGQQRILRADAAAPLLVRYTSTITNEALLPSIFQKAVSLQLAARLAPQFAGKQTKIDALRQRAEGITMQAAKRLALQASPMRWDGRDAQPDWVEDALR